ncbi:YmaF family protein [Lacrimispora sp.]|uniref:YmaF family protein n=1 Tax=Lacrimispora sp. TaxID=2719234 RepID=UPI0028A93DA4|nr:YmaF family protein [Lacrimispora sp.]
MDNYSQDWFKECCDCHNKRQTHDHEVQGSVEIAEREEDPHNHRFATVSGEAIPAGKSHIHEVKFRTDFYENHFHEFSGRTSLAIPVGGGRHVHFLESVTEVSDGHFHEFRVATLIEDPIGEEA